MQDSSGFSVILPNPNRITDKIAKVYQISTLAIFLYDSCPPYVPQCKTKASLSEESKAVELKIKSIGINFVSEGTKEYQYFQLLLIIYNTHTLDSPGGIADMNKVFIDNNLVKRQIILRNQANQDHRIFRSDISSLTSEVLTVL